MPLTRIMNAVLDTGYDGLFDLEVVGPDVAREGYESTIRRGVELASQLLTSIGA